MSHFGSDFDHFLDNGGPTAPSGPPTQSARHPGRSAPRAEPRRPSARGPANPPALPSEIDSAFSIDNPVRQAPLLRDHTARLNSRLRHRPGGADPAETNAMDELYRNEESDDGLGRVRRKPQRDGINLATTTESQAITRDGRNGRSQGNHRENAIFREDATIAQRESGIQRTRGEGVLGNSAETDRAVFDLRAADRNVRSRSKPFAGAGARLNQAPDRSAGVKAGLNPASRSNPSAGVDSAVPPTSRSKNPAAGLEPVLPLARSNLAAGLDSALPPASRSRPSAGLDSALLNPPSVLENPLKVRRLRKRAPPEMSEFNPLQQTETIELDRFTLGSSIYSPGPAAKPGSRAGGPEAARNSTPEPRRKKAKHAQSSQQHRPASHMGPTDPDSAGNGGERILDGLDRISLPSADGAGSLHSSFKGAENQAPPSPFSSSSEAGHRPRPHRQVSRMPELAEVSEVDDFAHGGDLRPRDPHEADAPIVFNVPIVEIQGIEYRDDENIDEDYLEQQLERSESESDEESDLGSVAEMLDDNDDEDRSDHEYALPETELIKEWQPPRAAVEDSDGSAYSDDDDDEVQALTESESEVSDPESPVVSSVAEARRMRGKRHRVPTLNFWDGERVEYVPEGKLGLLTAVDVRRVIPAVKTYRPRRTHRAPRSRTIRAEEVRDMEADAEQEDVRVPVFNPRDRQWHTETVAKSVVNSGFKPVVTQDGEVVPLVTRSDLFGGSTDDSPLQIYMLRIEVGGVYTRMLENYKSSLYLGWSGKCSVQLNTQKFDLPKGIAVYAPPANDLYIDNGSSTDSIGQGAVTLFVIDFDGAVSREVAQAMVQGAASMISKSQLDTPHDAYAQIRDRDQPTASPDENPDELDALDNDQEPFENYDDGEPVAAAHLPSEANDARDKPLSGKAQPSPAKKRQVSSSNLDTSFFDAFSSALGASHVHNLSDHRRPLAENKPKNASGGSLYPAPGKGDSGHTQDRRSKATAAETGAGLEEEDDDALLSAYLAGRISYGETRDKPREPYNFLDEPDYTGLHTSHTRRLLMSFEHRRQVQIDRLRDTE